MKARPGDNNFLVEEQMSRETLNIQILEDYLSQSYVESLYCEKTQAALQAVKSGLRRLQNCRCMVDRAVARSDRVSEAEA